MPAPEALTQEKRKRILDSARDVFATHGYEGASMSAITAAAGVSKATVYHHFTSKAALFGAFVARECEHMLAQSFNDAQPQTELEPFLRSIGRSMINLLISPTCVMIDRVVTAEAEAFPELAEAFYEAGPKRGIARMTGWLQEQVAAGRLTIEDPEFAAEQFFTLVQTRVVLRRRLRMQAVSTEDAELAVERAVWLFLKGYGTRV